MQLTLVALYLPTLTVFLATLPPGTYAWTRMHALIHTTHTHHNTHNLHDKMKILQCPHYLLLVTVTVLDDGSSQELSQ